MIPIWQQLKFAQECHSKMRHGDLKRVASGEMTDDEAQHRDEMQSAIVSTLERAAMLEEVSQEMGLQGRGFVVG